MRINDDAISAFLFRKNRLLQIKTVFMLNDDLSDLQCLPAAFVSKEILTIAGPLKACVIVVLPLLLFGNGPRKNRLYFGNVSYSGGTLTFYQRFNPRGFCHDNDILISLWHHQCQSVLNNIQC